MTIQEKHLQEQFKELLQLIYLKGQESETLHVNEILMEIKSKLEIVLLTKH